MRHLGDLWPFLCLACLCLVVVDAVEEGLVKPEEDALEYDLLAAPFTTTPPLREDAPDDDLLRLNPQPPDDDLLRLTPQPPDDDLLRLTPYPLGSTPLPHPLGDVRHP